MTDRFDYFVVFAEMRTGSNFLEANLNAFEDVACHGEAFNPHFIGYPNKTEILGVALSERDADPGALLSAVKEQDGTLGGFRFFNDHDPRVLETILADPRCAKIILTRNPMDSYVSWKIAQATGQWKLTDVRKRRDSKVTFNGAEFAQHVSRLQSFQVFLMNSLQKSGQTAFYVAYEDLQDVDIMNGLAKFLGLQSRLDALDGKLKRQNPSHISEKVENFDDIPVALRELDQFNLARTPNFEPRRGAMVPSYVAAKSAGVMFLPIAGGPDQAIRHWLAQIDEASVDELQTEFTQKSLRQWKRRNLPHRTFCVIRHPVARAHASFCQVILSTGPGSYKKIRRTLRNRFSLPIPEEMPDASYGAAEHAAAFKAYLGFVKANLAGQTAIRQDAYWSSQANLLAGFSNFASPDAILRESELSQGLKDIAVKVGVTLAADYVSQSEGLPFALRDIYDDEIEALCQDVYQRDYMAFGFKAWTPDAA